MLEDFKNDYDWQHAFFEACNGTYGPGYGDVNKGPIENVKRVIAESEGENDGDSWVCIVELNKPVENCLFMVVDAGCDYTGWDCQAGGTADYYPSEAVAISSLTPEQARRLGYVHESNS